MFEWCYRSRVTTVIFGIAVAGSVASLSGQAGVGRFAVPLGIAVGMPILVAGSPTIDGEAYLAGTTGRERAVNAAVTVAAGAVIGGLTTAGLSLVVGDPVPALAGAALAVLGGQGGFFYRNQAYLDVDEEPPAETADSPESPTAEEETAGEQERE
jgi:hypothetical protein